MTTAALKEKLHLYIDNADEKKLHDLFLFVEEEQSEKWDYQNDETFWDEMDRRVEELESGKEKGISWTDVKNKLEVRLKR